SVSRAAVVEEALDLSVGAGLVGRTVRQRVGDAERMPGPAAMEVPTEKLEGGHVCMGVDRAVHLRLRGAAVKRLPGGIDTGLRIESAASCLHERHPQCLS